MGASLSYLVLKQIKTMARDGSILALKGAGYKAKVKSSLSLVNDTSSLTTASMVQNAEGFLITY